MDRRTLLKMSLFPLGSSALTGCGSGGSGGPSGSMSPIAPATGQNVQGPLLPVSSADVAAVVARPEKILAKYQALAPGASADAYVRGALGANFASLASAGCFASYAAQFA